MSQCEPFKRVIRFGEGRGHREQHSSSKQLATTQVVPEREQEKGRKVEESKEIGKEVKKREEKGKREKGDREGSERGVVEEKQEEEVDKVMMDASRRDSRQFQIFIKVDGKRTVAMEVSPKYKEHDAVEKILNTVSGSDQDVYVTCE